MREGKRATAPAQRTTPPTLSPLQGRNSTQKVASQASEIGLSVLGKASAVLEGGDRKAVRVYEEGVGVGKGQEGWRGEESMGD